MHVGSADALQLVERGSRLMFVSIEHSFIDVTIWYLDGSPHNAEVNRFDA